MAVWVFVILLESFWLLSSTAAANRGATEQALLLDADTSAAELENPSTECKDTAATAMPIEQNAKLENLMMYGRCWKLLGGKREVCIETTTLLSTVHRTEHDSSIAAEDAIEDVVMAGLNT